MPAIIFSAPSLSNWRVQVPGGSILGAGTAVNLVEISGLRDLPGVRSGDVPRAQGDGYFAGLNQLGERPVQIKWDVTLAQGGVETALQTLAAAFQNISDPSTVCMTAGAYLGQVYGRLPAKTVSTLQFMLPGRPVPLWVFGRPTKYSVPIDLNYQYGKVQITTEWTSPDGVLYDGQVSNANTQLANPVAGLTFPASFPWTFGYASGGAMAVVNPGMYRAKPYFILSGACTNPIITNSATGQVLALNITLGTMDVLEIDCQAGSVTLNGTANRNNAVAVGSSFFSIQPGTSLINFTSSDGTLTNGTLNCYLLPTYSAV